MSWYTIFDEQESLLSTTSTGATLASTDALLIHNVGAGKKFQTTPRDITSMAGVAVQTLTSASTATNINYFGLTVIQSSNALQYVVSAPAVPGIYKTITTTSTATITVLCSGASLTSSGAGSGSQFVFNSAGGSVVGSGASMVSVGTTRWVMEAFSPLTIAS